MATQYTDNYDNSKQFSDTCCQMSLAANAEQTFTVPGANTQKYRAIFTFPCTASIYVGLNTTAATPAGGTNTTDAYVELNPKEPKYVKGGDEIHAVTPDAAGAQLGISLLTIFG